MSSCQYLLPRYSEGSSTDIWTESHWEWSLPECFTSSDVFVYISLLFREMAQTDGTDRLKSPCEGLYVEHRNEPPAPGSNPDRWRGAPTLYPLGHTASLTLPTSRCTPYTYLIQWNSPEKNTDQLHVWLSVPIVYIIMLCHNVLS